MPSIALLSIAALLILAGCASNAQTGSFQDQLLAGPGQTRWTDKWEVTMVDYGEVEKFTDRRIREPAQGTRIVIEMKIKNRQQATARIDNGDFSLQTADGRTFRPDTLTNSIEEGLWVGREVQPGLSVTRRVVFDVDPSAKGMRLDALGTRFAVG